MVQIFLDESGNTGEDLMNKDQPVFVIASLILDETACAELKEKFFRNVQARELKHSRLSRNLNRQKMVLEYVDYLSKNHHLVKLNVAHKKFVLVTRAVDILVETAAHQDGFDIYEKGFNLALCHIDFYTMPVIAGEQFFLAFLERFQSMIRLRTVQEYNSFHSLVFKEHTDKDLSEILDWFRAGLAVCGPNVIRTLPENSLDLAIPMALKNMAQCRASVSGKIHLIHDKSSAMSKEAVIWDKLMDPELTPTEIGYDRRRASFPIAVEQTSFEASQDRAGIQLADILAGATARYAGWISKGEPETDEYGKRLWVVMQDIPVDPIWPYPQFTPEELGTTGPNAADPIEFLARIIHETPKH